MQKSKPAVAPGAMASPPASRVPARFLRKSFFAAVALCLAPAAHALGASANASISNLRLELIDLNTNDGITPSIQVYNLERDTGSVTIGGVLRNPTYDFGYDYYDGFDTVFESVSPVRITEGLKTATADVSGRHCCTRDGVDSGEYLRMSTSASDTGHGLYGDNYTTYVLSFAGFSSGLLTSPNTRVVITAAASTSMAADFNVPPGLRGRVRGEARLSLYEYSANTPIADALSYSGYDGTSFQGALDDSRQLRVQFETGTSEKVFGFSVGTLATTNVYAVPEPSTYAMLIAGLVGIAFSAARAQRRSELHGDERPPG